MVWRRSAHIVSGGRPRGITFLVAYYALVGAGIFALAFVAVYVWRQIPESLAAFRFQPEALVLIAAAVGGVHGWTAWGLWRLRPWARLFVIALSIAGVIFGFLTLPLGFASILLNLGTFWYVTHHRIRDAFAGARRPTA